jgi:hypothetical protein
VKQKKPPSGKLKEKKEYNPFDDLSFWLHLATIDFGFLVKKTKDDSVLEAELALNEEQAKKQA